MDTHFSDSLRNLITDRFSYRSTSTTDTPSPVDNADYSPSAPPHEAEPLPPTTPANNQARTTPVKPKLSKSLELRQSSGKCGWAMKMEDFLSEFLSPLRTKCKRMGDFTKVTDARNEDEMPEAWINAIIHLCTDFEIVDTHNTDLIDYNGQKLKPDVSFFHGNDKGRKKDITILEMIAEFKFNDESDPLNDNEKKPIERKSIVGIKILAQITDYATSQFASQHRTHLFSLLVFRTFGRFLRWDRAGVIVSERVYFSDPQYTEFFWRFNHASPKDRGLDITVTRTLEIGKDIRGKLGLAEDAPLYQVTVTPQGPGYIIGTPMNLGAASPTGRSTRAYKAFSLETKTIVFLKDTWRVSIDHLKPEHEIYERLHKANVSNIPTVIEARDMDGQVTLTGEYAEKEWAKRISSMRVFQHYRLVLKEIGRELTSFNTTKELVTAIRDAVKAHREAFERAHVLHRDISTGNILITDSGGGLLIDWDLCKDLTIPSGVHSTERTGTWYFMAARLQEYREPPDELPVANFYDDLESFFLVMAYVAMRFTYHEVSSHIIKEKEHAIFQSYVLPKEGSKNKLPSGGDYKRIFIETGFRYISRDPKGFQRSPLVKLLERIRSTIAVLYEVPPTAKERQEYLELLEYYEEQKVSSKTPEALKRAIERDSVHCYDTKVEALINLDWLEGLINNALDVEKTWSVHSDKYVHVLPGNGLSKQQSSTDTSGIPPQASGASSSKPSSLQPTTEIQRRSERLASKSKSPQLTVHDEVDDRELSFS